MSRRNLENYYHTSPRTTPPRVEKSDETHEELEWEQQPPGYANQHRAGAANAKSDGVNEGISRQVGREGFERERQPRHNKESRGHGYVDHQRDMQRPSGDNPYQRQKNSDAVMDPSYKRINRVSNGASNVQNESDHRRKNLSSMQPASTFQQQRQQQQHQGSRPAGRVMSDNEIQWAKHIEQRGKGNSHSVIDPRRNNQLERSNRYNVRQVNSRNTVKNGDGDNNDMFNTRRLDSKKVQFPNPNTDPQKKIFFNSDDGKQSPRNLIENAYDAVGSTPMMGWSRNQEKLMTRSAPKSSFPRELGINLEYSSRNVPYEAVLLPQSTRVNELARSRSPSPMLVRSRSPSPKPIRSRSPSPVRVSNASFFSYDDVKYRTNSPMMGSRRGSPVVQIQEMMHATSNEWTLNLAPNGTIRAISPSSNSAPPINYRTHSNSPSHNNEFALNNDISGTSNIDSFKDIDKARIDEDRQSYEILRNAERQINELKTENLNLKKECGSLTTRLKTAASVINAFRKKDSNQTDNSSDRKNSSENSEVVNLRSKIEVLLKEIQLLHHENEVRGAYSETNLIQPDSSNSPSSSSRVDAANKQADFATKQVDFSNQYDNNKMYEDREKHKDEEIRKLRQIIEEMKMATADQEKGIAASKSSENPRSSHTQRKSDSCQTDEGGNERLHLLNELSDYRQQIEKLRRDLRQYEIQKSAETMIQSKLPEDDKTKSINSTENNFDERSRDEREKLYEEKIYELSNQLQESRSDIQKLRDQLNKPTLSSEAGSGKAIAGLFSLHRGSVSDHLAGDVFNFTWKSQVPTSSLKKKLSHVAQIMEETRDKLNFSRTETWAATADMFFQALKSATDSRPSDQNHSSYIAVHVSCMWELAEQGAQVIDERVGDADDMIIQPRKSVFRSNWTQNQSSVESSIKSTRSVDQHQRYPATTNSITERGGTIEQVIDKNEFRSDENVYEVEETNIFDDPDDVLTYNRKKDGEYCNNNISVDGDVKDFVPSLSRTKGIRSIQPIVNAESPKAGNQRLSKRTNTNTGVISNTSEDMGDIKKKVTKKSTRKSFPAVKGQGTIRASSDGRHRKHSAGSVDNIKSRNSGNGFASEYDKDAKGSLSQQPKAPSRPRTPSSYRKGGRGSSVTPTGASRVTEIKNMIKVRTPVDVPEFPDAYHNDHIGSRKNSCGSPTFPTAKRFDGPAIMQPNESQENLMLLLE